MNKKYNVLNFHGFIDIPVEDERKPISFKSGNIHELKPFVEKMTLDQLYFANSRCEVFKTGRLEFEDADKEVLFEELGIDKDSIITANEIVDTINNPTKEKLDRVIEINSLDTIDLYRSLVVSYRNLGSYDVSKKVIDVIEARRNEIYYEPDGKSSIINKKTKTEIEKEVEEKAIEAMMAKVIKEAEEKAEAKAQAKYEKMIKDLEAKNKTTAKTTKSKEKTDK